MDDTIDEDRDGSAGPSQSDTYRSDAECRYRPGRGGYDPEAAALAAEASYAFRQRMVLVLVLFAVISGVLAVALHMNGAWYLHGALDLGLVGYLAYLRRQVRLEQAIRARRAARGAGSRRSGGDQRLLDRTGTRDLDESASDRDRRPRTVAEAVAAREARREAGQNSPRSGESDELDEALTDEPSIDRSATDLEDQVPALPRLPAAPMPQPMPGTVRLELDDEDPELHDLADRHQRGYRRAAGQ